VPAGSFPQADQVVKDGPVPIYQQLKALLIRAVDDGSLRAHQRVPSERELGLQLGVSRMTARHAIAQLIAEGLLYTRTGKGTFVSDRKIQQPLEHLTSFTEEMRARGLEPTARVLRQELAPADEQIAGALGLPAGDQVVVLERLRLGGGDPMAIECAYLRADRCPDLDRLDLGQRSLYDLLRTRYGLKLTSARQAIEAALPTARQQHLLGIGPSAPVLHIERITFLDDGSPIELVLSSYRGDRYRLQVELRVRGGGSWGPAAAPTPGRP
jgi:GntR family transcriptional regulator